MTKQDLIFCVKTLGKIPAFGDGIGYKTTKLEIGAVAHLLVKELKKQDGGKIK